VSQDKDVQVYKSYWLNKVGSALSATPADRGRFSLLNVEGILN